MGMTDKGSKQRQSDTNAASYGRYMGLFISQPIVALMAVGNSANARMTSLS